MKTILLENTFAFVSRLVVVLFSFSLFNCENAAISHYAVTIDGDTSFIDPGASRKFTAIANHAPVQSVLWTILEPSGGTITSDGTYTAPSLPGTFTIKAVLPQGPSTFSTQFHVHVVIPVVHIPGYDVGVDYHCTTNDLVNTCFITRYNNPAVHQTVLTQLQGMADRGATIISTRIWFVNEPNNPNDPNNVQAWRASFPMTSQEQTNLRTYAQDVAKIVGAGGNRLRLDLGMLWLGAADYTRGDTVNGLGWTPISTSTFTSRLEETTDKLLDAVSDVRRPDGVQVVHIVYMEGEVMIEAKANQEWFLKRHYPRFVQRVSSTGLTPAVYFLAGASHFEHPLDPGFIDSEYSILNGHITMFYVYRSLRFMADNHLPLPARIDFSCYLDPLAGPFPDVVRRVLDDADATLTSLGTSKQYGVAETNYFTDADLTKAVGQAFAGEALRSSRLKSLTFWLPPDSAAVNTTSYPFAVEDFFLLGR